MLYICNKGVEFLKLSLSIWQVPTELFEGCKGFGVFEKESVEVIVPCQGSTELSPIIPRQRLSPKVLEQCLLVMLLSNFLRRGAGMKKVDLFIGNVRASMHPAGPIISFLARSTICCPDCEVTTSRQRQVPDLNAKLYRQSHKAMKVG